MSIGTSRFASILKAFISDIDLYFTLLANSMFITEYGSTNKFDAYKYFFFHIYIRYAFIGIPLKLPEKKMFAVPTLEA